MGPINQFTFCRLCLCTSSSLQDIFDAGNNRGYLVKETIEDLLQYKVIRVNCCPWLTCNNCRQKLDDFRRFKVNCLESKLAFENRYPQQFFLMAGNINLSTNPLQQPKALLLLPINHSPAVVGNVNTFQQKPSVSEAMTPDSDQCPASGHGPHAGQQHLEVRELQRAEACEMPGNLIQPKLEPMEILPEVSSIDVVDIKSEEPLYSPQLVTEDFQIETEETDVKDVLAQQSSIEPSMGRGGDGTPMVNAGKIEGHISGLVNHQTADPRKKTDSTDIGMKKLTMPIIMNKENLARENEERNFIRVLSGGQTNYDSGCPFPPSSVSQAETHLHGEPPSVKNSNVSPVDAQDKASPSSTIVRGLVIKPIGNSASNLENISKLLICSFGESITKSFSNATSNPQDKARKEGSSRNSKHKLSWKQGKLGLTGVRGVLRTKVRTYECVMCSKKFESHDDLTSHKLSHEGDPRPYKCPLCPRSYTGRKNQLGHHKSHYNVPQRFECEVCKAGFRFRHYLKLHMRSHMVKDSYPCKICGQVFKSSHSRARHVIRHREPRFPCPNCDKVFILKKELNSHQLTHSNKRAFQCDTCGKGFNKKQYLRCHLQLHDKVKRHSCLECGAKFSQYSALWQHKKWHQGNKKYVCEVCNRGFVLNSKLKQHKKQHTKTLNSMSGEADAKTLNGADGNDNTTGTEEHDGLKRKVKKRGKKALIKTDP